MTSRWIMFIIGTCVFLAVLIQVPQWQRMMNPLYKGVLVHLNSDEYQYMARVQQALEGKCDSIAEPYIGDPAIGGMQPGILECVYGTVFRFTGFSAPTVLQIMDSVVIVSVFLLLFIFFKVAGLPVLWAYIGSWIFILLELYYLNRPVHQGGSFSIVLLAIVLLSYGLGKQSTVVSSVAGVLFGILLGVYFWSWTYAWAWAGCAGLLFLWRWKYEKNPMPLVSYVYALSIGSLVASPFIWHMSELSNSPLWEAGVYRSGLHLSRVPESWPYSLLFLGMTIGVCVAYIRSLFVRKYWILVCPVLTGCIVVNQQIIHGHVLQFTSHYAYPLAFSALCCFLLSVFCLRHTRWFFLSLLCSLVFLGGIAWDNRYVFYQFIPREGEFAMQHLASLVPVLDSLPQQRILSDTDTSLFIAGSTHQHVVYSIYLQNALISHEEIAERYCLTQLPLSSDEWHINDQQHLVWPEANRTYPDTNARGSEVTMVQSACDRLARDPVSALHRYGVHSILWNTKSSPQWDLSRLDVSLEEIAGDDGWALYRITE